MFDLAKVDAALEAVPLDITAEVMLEKTVERLQPHPSLIWSTIHDLELGKFIWIVDSLWGENGLEGATLALALCIHAGVCYREILERNFIEIQCIYLVDRETKFFENMLDQLPRVPKLQSWIETASRVRGEVFVNGCLAALEVVERVQKENTRVATIIAREHAQSLASLNLGFSS